MYVEAAAGGGPLTSMMFGRSDQIPGDNTDFFTAPMGGRVNLHTDRENSTQVISAPGEFTKMRVEFDGALSAGDTVDYTLQIEGVASALTCQITSGNSACEGDCTNCDVGEGDQVVLHVAVAGGLSVGWPGHSLTFVSTNDDEQNYLGNVESDSNTVDEYSTICGTTLGPDTNPDTKGCLIPANGTIKDFLVEAFECPGGGRTRTFTIYKNGSPESTLTQVISGTGTPPTCHDTIDTSEVSVTAGDYISVEDAITQGSPGFTNHYYGLTFVPDTSGLAVHSATTDDDPSTGTEYLGVGNAGMNFRTSQGTEEIPIAEAITIKDMYVSFETAPGSGSSYTTTIDKDASPTAIECEISDTATTCNDTGNSESVANDAELSVQLTPDTSPTAPSGYRMGWSFTVP
jgi:hypothetical protein